MRHRIRLTLQPVDGALVRALSTVERRGFSIGDLTVRQEDGRMEVSIDALSPDRSIENLCRQLDKLVDVATVSVGDPTEALGTD